jgi:nitrogen fixation protein
MKLIEPTINRDAYWMTGGMICLQNGSLLAMPSPQHSAMSMTVHGLVLTM